MMRNEIQRVSAIWNKLTLMGAEYSPWTQESNGIEVELISEA